VGRRRKARELLVQSLYAATVGRQDLADATADQVERRQPSPESLDYVRQLGAILAEQAGELDRRIDAVLVHWRPERVGIVERCILRLALAELLFVPEIPPSAVIHEAVDLARTFSTEDAGRFVNGILDRLLEEERRSARG
jgi:N utilization substance protein B